MTLHPWQRNLIALKTGLTLRGKMKYECVVAPLVARPVAEHLRYTFTVQADNSHLAAREAAVQMAALMFPPDGTPGHISPMSAMEGHFLAVIGRQENATDHVGIVTRGFTVTIDVREPADA